MSERNWIPVAAPMPDNEALDAAERAEHAALLAGLSPQQAYEDDTLPVVPVTRAIAELNAQLIHDWRELERRRRHLSSLDPADVNRQQAWQYVDATARRVKDRETRLHLLLNAHTFHTLDWTHMIDDCVICQGEVTR